MRPRSIFLQDSQAHFSEPRAPLHLGAQRSVFRELERSLGSLLSEGDVNIIAQRAVTLHRRDSLRE